MAKPWGAWFEADYVAKTRWFRSAAQHGIYRGLLGYYGQNGPLPNDDEELRSICSATVEEWETYWPRIREVFFHLEKDGHLHNERADKEWTSGRTRFKRLSKRGKAGAEARWKKSRGADAQEAPDRAPPAGKPVRTPHETRTPPPVNPPRRSPEPTPGGERSTSRRAPKSPPPDSFDEAPDPEPARPDPNADAREAVRLWNEMAATAGLAKVQHVSPTRLSKVKARLKDCGGLEGWRVAIRKVETIPGLHGGIQGMSWRADFDWLLAASKFTRLMEGGYDNWTGPSGAAGNTKFGGRLSEQAIMEDIFRGAGIADPGDG